MASLEDDRMADGQNDNKTDSEVNICESEKRKRFDDIEHRLKKRAAFSFPRRKKDIYATNKTRFKAQLRICEKLLNSGESEVIIHGLGSAITRACNLALTLKKNYNGTVEIDVHTSTVPLIDDLEPLNDDADYEVNERNNSSIHIRVFRTVVIGPLRYA